MNSKLKRSYEYIRLDQNSHMMHQLIRSLERQMQGGASWLHSSIFQVYWTVADASQHPAQPRRVGRRPGVYLESNWDPRFSSAHTANASKQSCSRCRSTNHWNPPRHLGMLSRSEGDLILAEHDGCGLESNGESY